MTWDFSELSQSVLHRDTNWLFFCPVGNLNCVVMYDVTFVSIEFCFILVHVFFKEAFTNVLKTYALVQNVAIIRLNYLICFKQNKSWPKRIFVRTLVAEG